MVPIGQRLEEDRTVKNAELSETASTRTPLGFSFPQSKSEKSQEDRGGCGNRARPAHIPRPTASGLSGQGKSASSLPVSMETGSGSAKNSFTGNGMVRPSAGEHTRRGRKKEKIEKPHHHPPRHTHTVEMGCLLTLSAAPH